MSNSIITELDLRTGMPSVRSIFDKTAIKKYYPTVRRIITDEKDLWWKTDDQQGIFRRREWWEPKPEGLFGSNIYSNGDELSKGYIADSPQSWSDRRDTEVAGLIDILNLQPSSTILDCPGGTLGHSERLAKKKMKVIALELSIAQIRIGLDRIQKNKTFESFDYPLTIILGDMLTTLFNKKILTPNSFDAVLNMFFSFGFFTRKQNKQILKGICNLLKPGGMFTMHTDFNPNCETYKFNEDRPLDNGQILRIREQLVKKVIKGNEIKTILGTWSIGTETCDYEVQVYDVDEFIADCIEAGFSKVTVYASWDKTTYAQKPNSPMLIFVAEK